MNDVDDRIGAALRNGPDAPTAPAFADVEQRARRQGTVADHPSAGYHQNYHATSWTSLAEERGISSGRLARAARMLDPGAVRQGFRQVIDTLPHADTRAPVSERQRRSIGAIADQIRHVIAHAILQKRISFDDCGGWLSDDRR